MKDKKLKIEYWPLTAIEPYFQNAKTHKVNVIANSIEEFKPDQPIVVDADGIIIKGHGRLKGAKQLNMKEFPVIVRTDLSPMQVRASRLADNKSSEGGWDYDMLKVELSDIDFDMGKFDIDTDWIIETPEDEIKQAFESSDTMLADKPDGGAGVDDAQPPDDFGEYDEDIKTDYCCPKCQYRWSGKQG